MLETGRPIRTVTFLFTDVVGSTRLWEEHPEAMRLSLARHDDLIRRAVGSHGGTVFKAMGDAFCVAFGDPASALDAALALQHDITVEPWPRETPIQVRAALHTGPAEERDDDYFGPPLNRVARLLATGHGGQVLLSRVTHDLVRGALSPGVSLRDLGVHRLKDLDAPEHVFQATRPDLGADFPPIRSLSTHPNNLPQQLTTFIGREQELASLHDLMGRSRLVTLVGAGGAGKSRLSLQLAAEAMERFPDGVWFIELAPGSDPELVVGTAAAVLGVSARPGRTLEEAFVEALADRKALLILDNCEHVVAACASLAETVLRNCTQVHIVASSREPLAIQGEQTFRVPSLSAPEQDDALTLEEALRHDSVRLFFDRATLARAGFGAKEESAPAIATICRRLDGIPLAIELAAARVRSLSVVEIAERLDERFRLLIGGSRTALPRQKTLRSLIDWSYELLDPGERTLLARLSVFAGGWDMATAEAVCGDEDGCVNGIPVFDALASLVDKSLVASAEHGEKTRYRFLETVRAYALERLADHDEGPLVRDRHLDSFAVFVQRSQEGLNGTEQVEWVARLDTELDNVRAALDWARSRPEHRVRFVRLAVALELYWFLSGRWREGLGRALAAIELEAAPTEDRAGALNCAGALTLKLGDLLGARRLHLECLALREDLGDRGGATVSAANLALIEQELGNFEAARGRFEHVLVAFTELDRPHGVAQTLLCLGEIAQAQGDLAEARSRFEESLAVAEREALPFRITSALASIGGIALLEGKLDEAERHLQTALDSSNEIGAKKMIAWLLEQFGELAIRLEDHGKARDRFREALRLHAEIEAYDGIANSMSGLAFLASMQGRHVAASRIWGAAAAERDASGSPVWPYFQRELVERQARAREALGDARFEASWAEGHRMRKAEAITLALSDAE
ncbi:MAG: tetratricopeptide repeat protein [Fimbriimonadaceae bacterium]|nr:tetratricopeptide repeat protein [Fimbriimonadaceae bacterium]